MYERVFPLTSPRLSLDQRCELLAHLLRLPALFSLAQQHITPGVFAQADEPHLRVIWLTASAAVNRYGVQLLSASPQQARNLLHTEARAYAQGHPHYIPVEWHGTIDAFFGWAFDQLAAADLHHDYGLDLLKQFLRERAVSQALSDMVHNAGDDNIVDIGATLQQLHQRDAAIGRLGGGGRSLADEWGDFQASLAATRGRALLGLRTGMPVLDERTLGLRGLVALGAPPGVGKTALALQLGANVAAHNPDALVLFLSLEMARQSLYARLLSNRAGVDWRTVVLGSPSLRGNAAGPWLTPQDEGRLREAEAALHDSGLDRRLFILDQQGLGPDLTAASVLAHLEQAKAAAGAARALVVVDYLQLVPAPDHADLEADRHRVQFLKDLVRGTQAPANPAGDCVLAISELRKPAGGRRWHGQLSDLMGSARLPYALDAALFFRRMGEGDGDELHGYDWSAVGVPYPGPEHFEQARVAPVMLEMVKGRDGFEQFALALAFEYTRSRFTEISRFAGPVHYHQPASHHAASGPPNGVPAPLDPMESDI